MKKVIISSISVLTLSLSLVLFGGNDLKTENTAKEKQDNVVLYSQDPGGG